MIDTHCHLSHEAFENDIDEVIVRAVATGVRAALVLTEERADIPLVLELKARYPEWINVGFGIHPLQVRKDGSHLSRSVTMKVSEPAFGPFGLEFLQDMDGVRDIIVKNAEQLVAIGEVGLDFTPAICPSLDSHEIQRSVFTSQIRLARELNLPLNVHSRSASKPTIELLKTEGATRVQMHAFDGRPSQAMVGVAAGYFFSIPPCVYRSKQKQELVKAVPLTNLLLETDSPVLGVSAEQRNEPAEVIKSCEYIAQAKGVDVLTVRQITTENALKLYPNMILKQYH
ncbi:TatD DNase family protein [Paragonimus westermani]|uniref:TatD DNase family protein n=1 Tax=Paragonimus westermani TaxID=34504 RepID=A0A5J4NZA7_9TREM|nr:TatD DNase family protein [Paragonimus westermani]